MITSPIKFLGAYVTNVSCSLGWGGETSTCNITLVEDPQNNVFFLPAKAKSGIRTGKACLLKIGSAFEFGGILQRWTYSENTSDGRKYEVVLESPAKILDGVSFILDKFQGTIYKTDSLNLVADQATVSGIMTYGGKYPTNVINLFASKENYEAGGIFGGANVDMFGYPISGIVNDISNAANNQFNLIGGTGKFGGKIVYGDTQYDIDLSALNEVIAYIKDYKINGALNVTVNQLVKDITDIGLYDFIYIITGTADSDGIIQTNAKIVLKVLPRRSSPSPDAIKNLISTINTRPDDQKNLISYNIGKELSDSTTQKILIGGQASRYWMGSTQNLDIYPVWGKTGDGQFAVYNIGNLQDYNNFNTPIRIKVNGGYSDNFTYLDTDLLELRCAISGKETWDLYHLFKAIRSDLTNDPTYKRIMYGNVNFSLKQYKQLLQGKAVVNDLLETSLDAGEAFATYILGEQYQTAYIQRAIQARFESLRTAANEYYGKTFAVSVPVDRGGLSNNIKYLYNGIEVKTAWNVAESAWSGSTYRSFFTDVKYYDEDGRFNAVAIYDNLNTADYSELGEDYSVIPQFGIMTSVSLEKDLKWQTFTGQDSITGKPVEFVKGIVIANLNSSVKNYDQYTTETNGFNILARLIFGESFPIGYQNLFGNTELEVPIAPAPLIPKNIGVPQESERYVWGPWFSFNATAGKQGKVEIIEDTSFTPETFGSLEKMNQFAQTIVNTEMSQVYENESGMIELAEEPQYNLGAQFLNSGPYITSMSINIGANGVTTQYQFNSWTKTFGRIAKYNIDRIQKLQKGTFQFYKKLRNLFRNPPARAIDHALLAYIEKKNKKVERKYEIQGIFGSFVGLLANNINTQRVGVAGATGASGSTGSNNQVLNIISSAPTSALLAAGATGPTESPRLVVGGASVGAAMPKIGLNYDESFGCSMEQIFSPIVTFNQESTQALSPYPTRPTNQSIFPLLQINPTSIYPCFEKPKDYSDLTNRKGLFTKNNVAPTSRELDPYFAFVSNDFSCVLKDDRSHTFDINLIKDSAKYYVKTMGVRGPIILSGWGYDSAGLPVPSSGDSNTSAWYFSGTASQDRTKWKNGPVDLRWHKDRKVWVGGHDVLEGTLMEDLLPGSFSQPSFAKMKIYRSKYPTSPTDDHITTKDEFITISNRDQSLSAFSGAYAMVIEINYEWRPLWIECNGSPLNN
jgi:hypothetical protein